MKTEDTNLYTSPEFYLTGPEGMRNEVTMWYVGAGLFLQELVRRAKGSGFGGLEADVGTAMREKLGEVAVLDLCCGPGTFANYLGLVYPRVKVTGVDLNRGFLEDARSRFGPLGWEFVRADARTVDLGRQFDFVLGSSAYHHMPDEDKPDFLQTLHRHLVPGGKALICENLLPRYADEAERSASIHAYYGRLKQHYLDGSGTVEAVEAIEETYQLELSGNEEHKVHFEIFRQHIADAGLRIEVDIPVWQPEPFKEANAGSHVFLLAKQESPPK